MPPWERETWVDDDGSLTTGTEFDADHMNNIEDGIEEAGEALGEAVSALELLLGGKQPLDSDLTAIAALTTTEFGRSFLVLAGASAARTLLGLGTAAEEPASAFQPADSDLTAIAALTTTSFGRSVLTQSGAEATRTLLGLGTMATKASSEFQPIDSDLTAIAALSTSEFGRSLLTQASAAAARSTLGLGTAAVEPSSAFQPADSDLTAIAALTTTSIGRSLLAVADAAGGRTVLAAASQVALEAETARAEAAEALLFSKAEAGITDSKQSVRVATTANITIATALNNGDTLDGVTLATNDRVLVKDQTTTKENGIWIVGVSPVRAGDADAAGELSGGTTVYVEEGTRNKRRTFSILTAGSITPGTTSHEWSQLQAKDWGLRETLPTSEAVKGDLCRFVANKTDGVIWDLIYDGEGELPWKKIGGPPLISKTLTENSTASTTYVTLENSPSITTPAIKMEANIRIGGQVITTGSTAFVWWTLFTSGGSEVAAAGWQTNSGAPHGSNIFKGVALAASTAYTLRYKTSAGTLFASGRYIEIDPVRVA